jgi:hypothetical protein
VAEFKKKTNFSFSMTFYWFFKCKQNADRPLLMITCKWFGNY